MSAAESAFERISETIRRELRPLDSRETLEAVNRIADYLEGRVHDAASDIVDDERQEPVAVTYGRF